MFILQNALDDAHQHKPPFRMTIDVTSLTQAKHKGQQTSINNLTLKLGWAVQFRQFFRQFSFLSHLLTISQVESSQ